MIYSETLCPESDVSTERVKVCIRVGKAGLSGNDLEEGRNARPFMDCTSLDPCDNHERPTWCDS